ncbi:MAG: hypothetical protein CMH28_06705 [Micavibrio sp.]|nr:hypothetical protein [Micavibrio sp.]
MSKPDPLLHHLSETLKLTGQVAFVWNLTEDKLLFFGDNKGVFDCEAGELPSNSLEYNKKLNPEDLPYRLETLHTIFEGLSNEQKQADYKLKYSARHMDGSFIPLEEKGTAIYEPEEGQKIARGIIKIDAAALKENLILQGMDGALIKPDIMGDATAGRRYLQSMIEGLSKEHTRCLDRGFVLAVGIDRLSVMNEVYGHEVVDTIIEKTGKRLQELALEGGTVMRLGGDIHGVIFKNRLQKNMDELARYILQNFLRRPLVISNQSIQVFVSIGGKKIDEITLTPASLLVKVEKALQEAKGQGRGCYINYDESKVEGAEDYKNLLELGNDFLQGLRNNRVCVAYQPILGTNKDEVSFYECLIRLISEDGKLIPAGHFIDAIEHMGLTRLVDRFCMKNAVQELEKYPDIRLSINVSNQTLMDPEWLKELSSLLHGQKEVAARLIVEITESSAMQNIDYTLNIVRELQSLGCAVALDDFGSGQTSFSQLKDLNLNMVKIDKSFLMELDNHKNKLFIETLHTLAGGMDMETVAEGAQDAEVMKYLKDSGIQHIQGFAYGRPSVERLWLSEDDPDRHPVKLNTLKYEDLVKKET